MVLLRRGMAALGAVLVSAGAAVAAEPSHRPGAPPAPCDATLFSDQIGTDAPDTVTAAPRPERLWGLAGADRLTGSATRAACLFGGRDDDLLDLAAGGGIAWGEGGADTLRGGPLNDQLDGGSGVDGFHGGDGDDKLEARDGEAEIVDCGTGNDLVDADGADVLLSCEAAITGGARPVRLAADPRVARTSAIFRVRFRAPYAAGPGGYRVLLLSGARQPDCAGGPLEVTRFPAKGRRVRAGQEVRIGLRPPKGGWCVGTAEIALVLQRPCGRRCLAPPPVEPVARLQFRAR